MVQERAPFHVDWSSDRLYTIGGVVRYDPSGAWANDARRIRSTTAPVPQKATFSGYTPTCALVADLGLNQSQVEPMLEALQKLPRPAAPSREFVVTATWRWQHDSATGESGYFIEHVDVP